MKRFKILFICSLFIASIVYVSGCDEEDPCSNTICLNDGTCVNGDCDCPEGTSGAQCETVWRDALIGVHTGTEFCNDTNDFYEYRIRIGEGNSIDSYTEFSIDSLFGVPLNEPWYATMNRADSFTLFPAIRLSVDTPTYEYDLGNGAGTIMNGEVEIKYNVIVDGEEYNCKYVFKL